MTDLAQATAYIDVLKQELDAATTHINALTIAAAHVCEERDHLRTELDSTHRHMVQIVTEYDNEVEVLEASNASLQSDLRTSLAEQIRLLSHRRQLSLHLRGLMVLVRPGTCMASTITRPTPAPFVTERPVEECELPPTLLERLVAWFRKTRLSLAA